MTALMIKQDRFHNPLDIAEMVMLDRDLAFDRSGDGDLLAESSGMWSNYRLWLSWQEDLGGLTISCAMDTKLPKQSLLKVYSLLAVVNERMWLGHFGIDSETSQVMFRHAMLLKEDSGISSEQIQDMLDIAIQECERFYPALQAVVWGGKDPREALDIALFDTVAEA